MLVLHDPLRQTDLPRGCVATIGNFDGMHVGHQQIVRGVVERARELGQPSAVITFHPHPLTIVAPVDGVVLTRSIEPGQTVAASLQAPVLFQIAEDLAQMEIVLQIDEADIGQVKAGQAVNFTVDAFPERSFRGKVQQVRLSATNTNNVITYPVVVTVATGLPPSRWPKTSLSEDWTPIA